VRNYIYREQQTLLGPWLGLAAGLLLALPIALHFDPQHSVTIHLLIWSLTALAVVAMGRFGIEIGDDELRWQFGWFDKPGGRIRLDQVQQVLPGRLAWHEGWGIRRGPQGMLYNLSGRQTVTVVCKDGHRFRLGSQDPGRLIAAIVPRLTTAQGRPRRD
jgi:hypothetical protein